jgi:Na+-transporting methylmalonyl-CoA/oxaloacetate decarboxylase gamma subunit
MKQTHDTRTRLMYHARMFTLAVLGGVTIFLTGMGVIFLFLWLGIWHIEDR